MQIIKYLPLFLLFLACTSKQNNVIEKIAQEYVATYQARTNWDKFLSFYNDSLYMEDVVLGLQFKDKDAFEKFYDWSNPDFQKVNASDKTFELEDLVISRNKAVIKGEFLDFYWKGDLQTWANGFTIWLYFNENGKIIKQYDYIKYPAWIIESMED